MSTKLRGTATFAGVAAQNPGATDAPTRVDTTNARGVEKQAFGVEKEVRGDKKSARVAEKRFRAITNVMSSA